MEYFVSEIDQYQYNGIFGNEKSLAFQNCEFNMLNSHKMKEIKFLLFKCNNKIKFGLIGGLDEEGIFRVPFSAPFSLIHSIGNNRMIDFHEAVRSLINYANLKANIRGIQFTLPPLFYEEVTTSSLINALFVNGFLVKKIDLNYHYDLRKFNDNYMDSLDVKARQKLKASFKNDLIFHFASNEIQIIDAYKVIVDNRLSKGYPLNMSFDDIFKTINIIKANFFLVNDSMDKPIASAMVYDINDKISMVIYWGNASGTNELKPMNFLAYSLFKYYNKSGREILDIGPSSENSIPNFGLCDFKQGIGCSVSPKLTLSIDL